MASVPQRGPEAHGGKAMSEPVHRCGWASQPDIQVLCTGQMTTPAWGDASSGLPESVYRSDAGPLYTFTAELVTCTVCKERR